MSTIKWLLIAAIIFILSACGSGSTVVIPGTFDRATEIQAMISRHNATRSSAGVGQLTPNVLLNEIAQDQADYMASVNNLKHEDSAGHHVDGRATAIGYGWSTIGENIGFDTDPANLYAGWLASQGHHDNIVDPDFEELGVGVVQDGIYFYWCIVFGAQ
jgi:uncharacterized protein YkwD